MTKTERQIQKLKMHNRLTLIRKPTKEKKVEGILILPSGDILNTIENKSYILKKGLYSLHYEYSPKFKRKLWELKKTEPRSEIKFHLGTRAEHSKGCILLGNSGLEYLHNTLDCSKIYKIKIL